MVSSHRELGQNVFETFERILVKGLDSVFVQDELLDSEIPEGVGSQL